MRLLEPDAGFRAEVREGMAQADREEFSGGGEMDARGERMLNSPLLAHRTREKWGTRHRGRFGQRIGSTGRQDFLVLIPLYGLVPEARVDS